MSNRAPKTNQNPKTATENQLQSKIDQLDQLTAWFYGDEFSLDQALEKYQAAIELAETIKGDLKTLQNRVEILHENFTKEN